MPSKQRKGIIIVLDGLDGVGKATQSTRLLHQIRQHTDQVRLLSFPDYESPSSVLVQLYLQGAFAPSPDEVSPYAASSFYAVDRYASYHTAWKDDYQAGYILLMNRYTSSNAIHQMGKLDTAQWDDFLAWLDDYEHEKLGLPRPDLVLFLDLLRPLADQLLLSRYAGDHTKKDFHERDHAYLARCSAAAAYAAKAGAFRVISCYEEDAILPPDVIEHRILQHTREVLSFL